MSVGSVLIGLQASRRDGRGVTTAEFLAPLDIRSGEVEATRADGGAWASGMVCFSVTRLGAFAGAEEPTEAFFARLVEAFRAAGRFLDGRAQEVTSKLRACGLSLRLFIEIRMDHDQMELELPPELLAACGRHALGIYVISNDIPAADVLAGRTKSRSAADG